MRGRENEYLHRDTNTFFSMVLRGILPPFMSSPDILITGAGSGIGREFALNVGKEHDRHIQLIGDLSRDNLETVQSQMVAQCDIQEGNLFINDSELNDLVFTSKAKIIALFAAINIDDVPIASRGEHQWELANRQTDFLNSLIAAQLKTTSDTVRLILQINSASAFIADVFSEEAQEVSPYATMKAKQKRTLSVFRDLLINRGFDLSIVCPGAIDTGFSTRHSPEGVRNRFNHAGKWMKQKKSGQWARALFPWPFDTCGPKRFLQREVLKKKDVGAAIGTLANHFLQQNTIPDDMREWLMLNPEDCSTGSIFPSSSHAGT
jgi:NAD(P)-dependent dehydrogenase (short-subunit alcohol dehydrogenase family)